MPDKHSHALYDQYLEDLQILGKLYDGGSFYGPRKDLDFLLSAGYIRLTEHGSPVLTEAGKTFVEEF
jgi:hypothetical protein